MSEAYAIGEHDRMIAAMLQAGTSKSSITVTLEHGYASATGSQPICPGMCRPPVKCASGAPHRWVSSVC